MAKDLFNAHVYHDYYVLVGSLTVGLTAAFILHPEFVTY